MQRARKLKPLDEDLLDLEIAARIRLARSLALEKRWDEGRAQFAIIEQLDPAQNRRFDYVARKAVFETKAGQRDAADRYEKEALALLVEPTPLWLVLHIESIRFKLTKATQKHYADLFKKDLKKKCRSETAAAMASLLTAYLAEWRRLSRPRQARARREGLPGPDNAFEIPAGRPGSPSVSF